ncbi:MAG: 16S rRNA (guanine(966)-N(2))-methyltransferase RsmD [Clostridia bacterium]
MRVISGSARGLKLLSLEGDDTRPTLDRVKEALFSMLASYIYSAKVLDLFAGSGALGVESLSRGADWAVFVDSNPNAMNIVKENVKKASFSDKSSFYTLDAESYLKNTKDTFDLIFLDPPYFGDFYEKILNLISKYNVLNKNGILSVEWDNTLGSLPVPDCFEVYRERKYGRVMLTLLKLK